MLDYPYTFFFPSNCLINQIYGFWHSWINSILLHRMSWEWRFLVDNATLFYVHRWWEGLGEREFQIWWFPIDGRGFESGINREWDCRKPSWKTGDGFSTTSCHVFPGQCGGCWYKVPPPRRSLSCNRNFCRYFFLLVPCNWSDYQDEGIIQAALSSLCSQEGIWQRKKWPPGPGTLFICVFM